MQILLIMLIVVLLAFSVLLLALAKQSPREKQTEDKEQEEYIRDYAETVRQTGGSMKKLEHWKVIAIYLIIYDMIAVNFSYFMALLVRFDFRYSSIPTDYFAAWRSFAPIYTIIILAVFGCMHLYNSVWRFASFHELIKITVATVITGVLHIVGITIFWERMPASYYLIGIMLQFFLTVGVRFSYRFVLLERNRREKSEREERSKNVMIIGAGEAGRTIVRELQNAKETNSRVRCLIDDNPNKWGRYMEGVPVVGGRDDIFLNVDKYHINQLKASYPNLNLKVLIGSVRDSKRINWVFETYKPEIVYHAAAHKHVPLMENSPCEAIKNNVVGTYKTAYAAMMNGCQRFVLISTDKAVNPTNIMGASKRLCEMVVQSMNMVSHNGHTDWLPRLGGHRKDTLDALHDNEGQAYVSENPASEAGTGTEFVAVRFGNVLGSNGSVIPLFKRQIEKGGPVTVTHPDIIRYFMTIPEAVSLVLQAGTYAKGGEIFVLDMGAPVKIDTLARNLIKLSGYTPDVDIKVTYTGLRPGEKLYEEKLMAEEGMEKTPNDLIHIGKPIEMDVQEFFKQLEVLAAYGYANSEKIRDIVAAIVPTYHSADSDLKLHKKVYEELMSEAAVAAEKN